METTDLSLSRWNWTVELDGGASERADKELHRALERGDGEWDGEPVSCSRSRVQKLLEEGAVTMDGAAIEAKSKLAQGAEVIIRFPAPPPSTVEAEDRELEILFEDDHLLVINKPPGMTVHPSPTQMSNTLVNALLHYTATGKLSRLSDVGGPMRPGIVHRLDKDTSGALLITKTDVAHRAMIEVFSNHDIERAYWALCYGSPRDAAGKIESTIGRSQADRKRMAMNVKGGKNALTRVKRLEEYRAGSAANAFASWLELTLETGRTHQIRVHLTGAGTSVLGDPVYGTPTEAQSKWRALPEPVAAAVRALPGQALHARVLGFKHPVTGEALRFTAEPPAEFRALLEALRGFQRT